MNLIRSITFLPSSTPNGWTILYLLGHGGHTWQAKRQLKILNRTGYKIIALDFSFSISSPNPKDLIDLMDEVDEQVVMEQLDLSKLIIIGISLGGLVGYNLLRRHKELKKLIIITGGNIALLPSSRSLKNKWKLTREQLFEKWKDVNAFTPEGSLKGKQILMLLPIRDKVIDPNEVATELKLHMPHNKISLLRTKGGHFRTIITETIIKPQNILKYIKELE